MAKKRQFPQDVLLGELPKDKSLRGNERFGWGGKQYFVALDARINSKKASHYPANHIRGYWASYGTFKPVEGFGVFIDHRPVQIGEIEATYVGKASTIFELQDLIGVPRVRPMDGADSGVSTRVDSEE